VRKTGKCHFITFCGFFLSIWGPQVDSAMGFKRKSEQESLGQSGKVTFPPSMPKFEIFVPLS